MLIAARTVDRILIEFNQPGSIQLSLIKDKSYPMVLGNALNMLLSPLLMFSFGWGTAGASIATLCGQLVAAFYIRSRLLKAGLITPSITWEATMFKRWQEIGKLGFVVALTFLISPLGLAMVNGVLANLGAATIGAWNIMSRLEMMFMLPLNGMAGALIPFIAFNYGQGNWDRIKHGMISTRCHFRFYVGSLRSLLEPADCDGLISNLVLLFIVAID